MGGFSTLGSCKTIGEFITNHKTNKNEKKNREKRLY